MSSPSHHGAIHGPPSSTGAEVAREGDAASPPPAYINDADRSSSLADSLSDDLDKSPAMAANPPPPPMTNDPAFDILDWHPAYISCQRYFLDHAQHEPATQALCALINIRLPFQWRTKPVTSFAPSQRSTGPSGSAPGYGSYNRAGAGVSTQSPTMRSPRDTPPHGPFVSLVPYIRRLVITAFDKPAILHGFFGDDFQAGAVPHVDCERRNYLFAAKHGGWQSCKKQYDTGSGGGGDESVPFMKPLDQARPEELAAAEKAWSEWSAMEDWAVGSRSPDSQRQGSGRGQQGSAAFERRGGGRRDEEMR